MKKIVLGMVCAVAMCSCAKQHSLTVKLSDLKSDTVTVAIVNSEMSGIEKTDTVLVQNGEMTYDYQGDKVAMAMLGLVGPEGPTRLQVYLVPGEQGTLVGDTKSATWSGSKFYTELAELEAVTDPIQKQLEDIVQDFQKQVQAGANQDSLQAAIMPQYEKISKQYSDANADFVKNHPSSGVSATLLGMLEDPAEAMGQLSEDLKKGPFSNLIDAVQDRIDKEAARKEAAKSVADGCEAPDFTLRDINGKNLSLSSLRGQYVILDFWGSWCGWCIKGMPEMKKYYEKYAGKFEIVGVDCNDSPEKWKEAVAKNELPWKHVYNPKDSKLLTQYAIEGFPTKLIIDPEGKIVKTVVGEDPKFYESLDSLFSK